MSGKPTRQRKQLIINLKSFIQRSNQTAVGSREPSRWKRETGRWEGGKKRPWWEKSQQNEVIWRLALWWQSQWKCKRLVAGGACCLGSKVHLLYLFPMVLVPMAHSSPMADITETCGGHWVRTPNIEQNIWIVHTYSALYGDKKVLIPFLETPCNPNIFATFKKCLKVRKKKEQSRWTYKEFLTSLKLRHDFFSDLIVRDTQVLSDVTIVTHQGHVVIGDVEQLCQRISENSIRARERHFLMVLK